MDGAPITRPKGLLLGREISRDLNKLQPDELIDSWLRLGALSAIFGEDGVGKSRLMNALLCFGAVPDLQFQGLTKKRPFKSVFFAPEGLDSILLAHEACLHLYGPDAAEHILDGVHYVDLQEIAPFQIHEKAGYEFMAETLSWLEHQGIKIEAIAVDSISMTTDGEQVDPKVVHAALMNVKNLAKTRKLAAIVAGHKNRQKRYEGSAMWRRHPVIIREIDGTATSKRFTIKETKQRDRALSASLTYAITPVPIGGVEVDGVATIMALRPAPLKTSPTQKSAKMTKGAPKATKEGDYRKRIPSIVDATPDQRIVRPELYEQLGAITKADIAAAKRAIKNLQESYGSDRASVFRK